MEVREGKAQQIPLRGATAAGMLCLAGIGEDFKRERDREIERGSEGYRE